MLEVIFMYFQMYTIMMNIMIVIDWYVMRNNTKNMKILFSNNNEKDVCVLMEAPKQRIDYGDKLLHQGERREFEIADDCDLLVYQFTDTNAVIRVTKEKK